MINLGYKDSRPKELNCSSSASGLILSTMDIFSLLSLLLLLVVIVIAIGYLLTYPPAYKSLFNMPGPPKKWVIGNVLDIKPDTAGSINLIIKLIKSRDELEVDLKS